MKNLISIIIPTRNGNVYILNAINSIKKQTYKNIEIIIVDDNDANSKTSTELREIIDQLNNQNIQSEQLISESEIPLITPIQVINGITKGPGIARDTGISFAKGSLIAFLDDDDQWTDVFKLEKQMAYLEHNPSIKVTGVEKTIFINEQNKKIKEITQPISPDKTREQMLLRNPIITSSVLMYKETYESIGGFKEMYLAEDYDLWLRIGRSSIFNLHTNSFPISNTPKTEISYLVRKNSASNKQALSLAWTVLFLILQNFFYYPHNILAVIKAKLRILKALLRM